MSRTFEGLIPMRNLQLWNVPTCDKRQLFVIVLSLVMNTSFYEL